MLGEGNRVQIAMWSKAWVFLGACSIPCKTYTRRAGLAWQLDALSEMCMGKQLGLDIKVRVLSLTFKYLFGCE